VTGDVSQEQSGLVSAVFDNEASLADGLSSLCRTLIDEQRRAWPLLARAYESLATTLERKVACTGFSVRVQRNPGRMASTAARVENGDTNGRPCFLCSDRLPPEQRGILYRNDYLILPNPMPVVPLHCTVAATRHEPQAISGKIGDFLRLALDLGRDWTVLYNGPRCGASAPDHSHFQIIPAHSLPIESEVVEEERCVPSTQIGEVLVSRVTDLGRQAVMLEGTDIDGTKRAFDNFFLAFQRAAGEEGEPMLNICGFHREDRFVLVVFPRRKHRPDVFFKTGDERVVVSPAIVEMGGILVTPVERDFARLDAPLVESIFAEVSFSAPDLDDVLRSL
jgi:hypothetical protein